MNLDEAQKKHVAQWIADGLKLSEIQGRLNSELGLSLTYMEVRLLVDDLKLMPKDQEPPAPSPALAGPPVGASPTRPPPEQGPAPAPEGTPGGRVSITVDQIARPGALISGGVTFSDGKSATWYLDQTGRLGLMPKEPGYKPSPADVQSFQVQLQDQLQRMGM